MNKNQADSSDITKHPRDGKPRPYSCTVCEKRFTRKDHLNDHRKRHTGENLYSCTQCGKRFSSQSSLSDHMNIHSSKYRCTQCDKCFESSRTWQHTDEVIQEGNRLNVLFAGNDLHRLDTLLYTAEFTVDGNHTNVMCVPRHLVSLEI